MSDIEKLTPGQKPSAADKLVVAISESKGHQGRVTNLSYKWPDLCEKLGRTNRDNLTTREFYKLSETAQHKRKNTGYFVGGTFDKGARKVTALKVRTVLTLDVDNCDVNRASELFDPFDGPLSEVEYFAYTTRSHAPERPRIRVVIPLAEPIHPDKLDPVTRLVAQKLDPAMETVDPVSFRPAQIMYLPSTNQDAEFRSKRNRGRLLDANELLTAFGDWSNYNLLPRSPREKSPRKVANKAQDPTTKRGLIGAFCRIYTVHDVIDKFLSDVYVPGETGPDGTERYTYTKGSTTNGVVVYEDGKFVFSWHGTDPAGGRLSNAFDLYRIHKFGHLDRPDDIDKAEEENNPTLLPSYKAARDALPEEATEVMAELTRALYDQEAMADDAEFELDEDDAIDPEVNSDSVTEIETPADATPSQKRDKATSPAVPAAEPAPAKDWLDDLDRNERGGVKNTLHNVILILQHDKRFIGRIAYNEFMSTNVIIKRIRAKQYGHDTGPIQDKGNGDIIGGGAVLAIIRAILEGPRGEGKTGWGMVVKDKDLRDAVDRVALDHKFHPVREYIKRCRWDGELRLGKLLHTYWHVPDNKYHSIVGELWLVGTLARVFEPGHKFDSMPIFEGPEGLGKTTGPQALLRPEWSGQFEANPSEPEEVVENLQGKVFVEMAELNTMIRSNTESMKALVSATVNRTRLAWERGAKEYLRQCTFYGTTNDREYFKDRQGNRRYWPILVDQPVDIDGLIRDRDQIWAEVYQVYLWYRRNHDPSRPLPLYIRDPKVKAYAEEQQASRVVQDEYASMKGMIEAWLDEPVPESQAKPGWKPGEDEEYGVARGGENLIRREVVCINDILLLCLDTRVNSDGGNRNNQARKSIGAILTNSRGWVKGKNSRCGQWGVQQVWMRDNHGL